jgi:predicted P-loop ATPase
MTTVSKKYKRVTFSDKFKQGNPKSTFKNFSELLEAYNFSPRFNFLKREIIIPNQELDNKEWPGEHRLENMITHIIDLCNYHSLKIPDRTVIRFLTLIASENSFNPVADWILEREWDGKERVRELYETLDVQENKEFLFTLFEKWLGYIVHCAFSYEGVATQGVLVLVGPENCGKTTWLSNLLPREKEWILSGENSLEPKPDTFQKIDGFAVVEFGEISALFNNPKTMEWLKALITSEKRTYRIPWGRGPITRPNLTVFAGTDNNQILFPADYGKLLRRWWVLLVGKNMNAFHGIDTQQVFAELHHNFKTYPEKNKSLGLSESELQKLAAINSNHCEEDPIYEAILRKWEWEEFILEDRITWKEKLTVGQTAEVLGLNPTRRNTNHIGKILRQITGLTNPMRSNGLKVFPFPSRNIGANAHLISPLNFSN